MVFLPASVTSHMTLFHLTLWMTLGVALVGAQGHMGHNASTMSSMAPSMENSNMTMHHGPTHEMSNGNSKNMTTSGTTNATGSMDHQQTMSNGTMSHGNTMPIGGAHGTQSTGSMTQSGENGTQSTGSMTHGSAHGTQSTGTMTHSGAHGTQSAGTMPPSSGHGSGHGSGHPTDSSSVATDGGGHGSGHDSGGSSTGHYGFFHITFNTVILFEQWITNTWQGLLASCVGIGVAAALYEGFKLLRSTIAKKARKQFNGKFTETPTIAQKMCSGYHLLQAVLHTIQAIYSYMLMLVFMTFNLWLCLSVALGFGLGYLLFRVNESSSDDSNEHCM